LDASIIAIDIDEVLAEFVQGFLEYHNAEYCTDFRKEQVTDYHLSNLLGVSSEETIKRLSDFYKTGYFRNIMLVPGAAEGIKQLRQNNKLIVITARPKEIHNITIDWIGSNFKDSFSDIYFTSSCYFNNGLKKTKADICLENKVNILVEDSLDYAADCAKANVGVFLFDRPWNRKKEPRGVIRVKSWKDILSGNYIAA